MKRHNQLGYTLAAIYFLIATVILLRWATDISPVKHDWFLGNGHKLSEAIILSLPLLPAIISGHLLNAASIKVHDSLIFVELASTLYFFLLVILNTISWFFTGKLIQLSITNLLHYLLQKIVRKKPDSKV